LASQNKGTMDIGPASQRASLGTRDRVHCAMRLEARLAGQVFVSTPQARSPSHGLAVRRWLGWKQLAGRPSPPQRDKAAVGSKRPRLQRAALVMGGDASPATGWVGSWAGCGSGCRATAQTASGKQQDGAASTTLSCRGRAGGQRRWTKMGRDAGHSLGYSLVSVGGHRSAMSLLQVAHSD
jgi:hypothetical protein